MGEEDLRSELLTIQLSCRVKIMKAEKEIHTENPISLGTRVNTTTDMMQIRGEDTAN